MGKLRVDFISDISCPFCALGLYQLRSAAKALNQELDFHFHPFEINPHLGDEGADVAENLYQKYQMPKSEVEKNYARFKAQGEKLGFTFDYFDGKRVYPSFRAHQLLEMVADEREKQLTLKLALLDAVFASKCNVNEIDDLLEIARDAGIDPINARKALEENQYAKTTREHIEAMQRLGVSGVPTIIFNQKEAVSGAIGAENFHNLLTQLAQE